MAEDLANLCRFLFEESDLPSPASADLFLRRLRSDDSIKRGLRLFYLILRDAVSPIGGDDDSGKLRLEDWSDSQVQTAVSIARAVLLLLRSLSVDQVDPIVLGVTQEIMEFSLCFLEKLDFRRSDLRKEINIDTVLEIASFDGNEKHYDVLPAVNPDHAADLWPGFSVLRDDIEPYSLVQCTFQGGRCSNEDKPVDHLLIELMSECVQPDGQIQLVGKPSFPQDLRKLNPLTRHLLVVHLGCVRRLIMVCKELIQLPDGFDEKMIDPDLLDRLSFCLRILKLLGSLSKDVHGIENDAALLRAVALFADALPNLFGVFLDFSNHAAVEGNIESLSLALVEGFLSLLQNIFGKNNVFQNVEACIAAGLVRSLDASVWRYDASSCNVRSPLAYFPRTVIYMCRLIQDIKRQAYHIQDLKVFGPEFNCDNANASVDFAYCHLQQEKILLHKCFTAEEIMKLIFPSSSLWVDNLFHLVYFLHREGAKLRPKVERISSLRSNSIAEVESQISHEDDALFGNLFSECSRSLCSIEPYDQPPVAVSNNLPLQAARELLSFLKTCIFCHEWLPTVYEDGCKALDVCHIDILLNILSCSFCCLEDKASDSGCMLQEEGKSGYISSELLFNLLRTHALSDSLESYLIRQILVVENGNFKYTDKTLALLAHTIFCRPGLAGAQLRTKICDGFVTFIAERANEICSGGLNPNEFTVGLPSAFHVQIVLMAFHLSAEAEKTNLSNLIASCLHKINVPSGVFCGPQLSCWAMLISRLLVLLRHMLYYPSTCPTSLLLDVRSKLREVRGTGTNLHVSDGDQSSSWVSLVAKDIIESWAEEESLASLISEMIDAVPHPPGVQMDVAAAKPLCLNWGDLSATLFQILGLWKGKKPQNVEELIVERYVFMLSWDISLVSCALDSQPSFNVDYNNLDISSIEDLIRTSHLLLGHSNVAVKDVELRSILIRVLYQLHAATGQGVDDLGWDFIREGSWLSLLLYFLNAGIWGYCKKKSCPEIDSFWRECTLVDAEYSDAAEGIVSCLMEAGDTAELLRMLSSLLSKYLQVYKKAFLATSSTGNDHASSPPFLLLLKHTQFGRSLQAEFEKNGGSSLHLQCILYLSKLDAVGDRRGLGILCKVLWESMVHGFPSSLQISSAALLSCTLSIRSILLSIFGLFKLDNSMAKVVADRSMLKELLSAVMIIKFDKIFESLHGKCEEILQNVYAALELPDFSQLFLLKDMEGFVTDISAGEINDSNVLERVITEIVDVMDKLSKDSSRSNIFKFYLGVDAISKHACEFYQLQRGDLSVLIDSLDYCSSELVNTKVLNFLVDILSAELCSDLRRRISQKFIDMDVVNLSGWLERRLLGSLVEAIDGKKMARGNSLPFREAAMNFINCLVSSTSDSSSRELQDHLFEAMLISLDTAFLLFDIHMAVSHFHFVLQLAREENLMKLLLKRSLKLMEKLAGNEKLLSGLKFLFSVMATLLRNCGSPRYGEISRGNSSNKNTATVHSVPKPAGSVKKSQALTLSVDQEGGSTPLECDVTSVDEDEDDGTSDGEVASLDKEDEEDGNSERSLASKVCTFTSSGSNFIEQHWYFCYTCDLTVSKGCCSVCAKVCHRGHRVVYSRSSRFFCDCGAGGVRGSSCQCSKPRKVTNTGSTPARGVSTFQSFLPFSEDADQLAESDSDLDEDGTLEENCDVLSIPKEIQHRMPLLLEELGIEDRVMELCSSLLLSITGKRDSGLSKDKQVSLGKDKVLLFVTDLLQLKKAYKSGSLDLKIKADYANAKDLKSHIASGSLVKSLLSVSVRGRLAVGEGDKVSIFDVGQLVGQATIAPINADKANVKPLSRNIVRFEIVHLSFNSVVESYLAVAGLEDCQILTLNHRGEVTDRLAVELVLEDAYIRRIDWVPGSQVQLMVVTNKFVKIYDLSLDNISPTHYFTLSNGMIVDATLFVASRGRLILIVLSEQGNLYRFELSLGENAGATPLKEIIEIRGKDVKGKGSSVYFSPTYRLLFISYLDGTSLVGRLSLDATYFTETSCIFEEEPDGKQRAAGLHRWTELLVGSGLFVCFSSLKSNTALVLSMGGDEICAQNLRHPTGSSSPIVGMTAYKPLSKDNIHCLVLHDDGSLQIYSHVLMGVDSGSSATAEKVKKLGSKILSNKVYAGAKPDFPLDFFEKTVCISADVRLGGDVIRNGDSEGAKQNLASEDGFIESPSPMGFKISVSNPNPDIVMVGLRVHVGNTSASSIPSEITIFQRLIKMDEGMRCWYDIPFTVAESLLADEDFVIAVGPTFSGTALPRIDSLEVYGRAKDEFGWKEKMEAVLDMEARVLGCGSLVAGSRKKRASIHSASIQEQVFADGLKLLANFYSVCRAPQEVKLSEVKCKQLLEAIFESDRETLLQAAACRVLHSVFPEKEMYYQVKDTMRLLGVIKATSILSSSLGVSGAGGWIVKEFSAQMQAVSKIALTRKSNFSSFLQMNGSEVVDSLMHVLWGILESEPLDTQTMNNIVMSSVELIYSYAECLASQGKDADMHSVAPAVRLLKKLILFPNEAVQTSSSLAISSRLLQVPFPKQTMLTTDDAVDNVTTPAMPIRSGGGSAQVMIEEDSITSSVHYCCDGCSTVPILRRRWHCTVCPDFDLCEACYEVLDADRLPPPHTRDHPMTAIAIDVESLGADTNEIQFSADEAGVSNLIPVITSSGSQTSAPSIHVLEPGESGEFSASMTDPVSISASKRAVNSLILSELLEELSGWMGTASGVQAVPVMQLLYRLSSAIGGAFMDSSNPGDISLERLINWLLEEIDLSKPFSARTRSSFGEVVILVFMFFTLMLRNWHQPGSDSTSSRASGSTDAHDRRSAQSSISIVSQSLDAQEREDFTSQLLRASGRLRTQQFVNYLMNILQQLVHVFKSPTASAECGHGSSSGSGCGALLTVRRDLSAGNYSPFFSDSYAKAHRTDMFVDYHRLLLENVFRLVYTLVRPEKQEKMGDKEKVCKSASSKDLKLDGFQDVLCSYINNPYTTFVRRYTRRLFLHICGSKTQYYSVRDSWQFSNEVKRLYKHVEKSGGIENNVSYERSVKIVRSLSTIGEVAAARPRNWQKYCLRHGDVLSFLLNGIFHFAEESVIQTLKLLNLAFYSGKDVSSSSQRAETNDVGTGSNRLGSQSLESKKKKKGEDGNDSGSEKLYVDMEGVVDIFNAKGGDVLRQFIDIFLLEWNSSAVRMEAKSAIYGLWHHGRPSFKESLLAVLLQKVRHLPAYGQNIVEYTELVTLLLGKAPENNTKPAINELVDRCLTPDVIRCIFETLHSQNELIANHPNSRIYSTLSNLVEFDGYYLESEPCVACSSPDVPYSRMKLESLKSETKFTDNRIIVKCAGSYTIQSVTMNVHDARKSKSVKVLNLYYNNRPVSDLSELKNNWSLWKRAKSCHLAFNQTELKVEFPIPITACNFMIELDSFYENLQALSLEPLQCPRCSRPVTDKHGICGNCHENAYQCRQCRNINYENLDSFLCNECGYSKYGRFEFNFMAKPSFIFDNMENDEDMKRGLAAIEAESENAHRRYQQLLGFKKPLLKIVSSIGESEMDSQHKDTVQQMMASLPGPSCKINRKIALLGVLYGEKCKAAFDSVSKSVQTLQGLRRVLMVYLHQKNSNFSSSASRCTVSRTPNNCYGCATTFVTQCLEILQVLAKHLSSRKQLVASGILSELFENNIHQGPKAARSQARAALCTFAEGDLNAVNELNNLIQKKIMYCLEHHRSMDIALATREEMSLLSEVCSLPDEFWESRLRLIFQLLFSSIKLGAKHPAISEHIILPCLKIISQACTPPKPDAAEKEQTIGKSTTAQGKDENGAGISKSSETIENNLDASQKTQDIQLVSYLEWEKGASYLDFVRRQYKASQAIRGASQRSRAHRSDFLALKYALRWKRRTCKTSKGGLKAFELGPWVSEVVLSACSQSIRSEMCTLISLLCAQSSPRCYRLLNLLMGLLPATLAAGESSAEYFELLFKMVESEDARLFLTVRGCLTAICKLISQEVVNIESLERSLRIDISQGFSLHKLIELLGKFLEVSNIRSRFMRDNLLSHVLEALIVIRGLIVQKTKLINDCNRLLKDLLDSLLLESSENKRQFIRACVSGLQTHAELKKGRTCLFILEQLCNLICPSKPEAVYMLILNKAHTQEEFIRGSMTRNPYSSAEIGPLMRDVKNKICQQLDMLGLLEDDYGMELLVAGNIISLDLSIAQVYEQVWKKSNTQSSSVLANSTLVASSAAAASRDCPPMTVTYRLQGLDGEATEPMIKELEEDREESQDPEVEFAIAGAVREYGGLEILLDMIKHLRDDFKSNQEEMDAVLNLLNHCCKIRENRRALLRLGALSLLLETARRAFSVDAMEPAEGILLIVESLTLEANESDSISATQGALTVTNEETGTWEQAKKIVLMFLERLSHPSGLKKSNKQQRNTEMVARILPYLTYGEPAAMEALIQHFNPYLQDWAEFNRVQRQYEENPKDESTAQQAMKQKFTVENFVRVSESLKTSSCGERLKDIVLEKGIIAVAVKHLKESFAVTGQAGFKSSAEWPSALKLPSVPLILSMLRGLSMGHLPTQTCIYEGGILPLLHAMEGVCVENEIGARAENLLDTLADKEGKGDGYLGEKVRALRDATKDEMRRRALRKREELLQGLGMRQEHGGERIVVSQPILEGFEDVEEEEDGLACMVCREGYKLRPTDLLGVYSYSKRVNLGGECVYTTVSSFNIIHFQCHQEAKRADAALRNPKKEWEGATLRNNESLCNSLFPVRGPSVPLAQYVRYVDQYWDNLTALGRADGTKLRLLTYDIVLMLARFATGASFRADSRGGGRESNSRFLPFMIQMARHLLDQGGLSQRTNMANALSLYVSSSSSSSSSLTTPWDTRPSTPGSQPSGGTEETVQFMMVNSLLSESYESWLQHRRIFLQRGIYHTFMQHTHGRTSSSESATSSKTVNPEALSSDELLSIVRPILAYTGMIEQLQQFFKVKKPSTVDPNKKEGTTVGGGELEAWEIVMKEKLMNVKEMAGFSKVMLSWLDDMNSSTDLQEAFDVVDVLADVLSGGFTQCDEFVRSAINVGKG
ncbi:PREDICTED: auxin transport protein BIG [Tarenaya hassleriana]|uniref:auxin transport protein BIG n=1 Tax=Tarenaya hassleriana TaxID=28532 RepID=UPI00053C3E00|nr:PREDICTED: auxin transport protein BIG [Tarenaya hassleriana]